MKGVFKLRVQFATAFPVLLSLYMLFAIMDSQLGADGLVGLLIFQPIFGSILTISTLLICFIIGLPIRFVGFINRWWIANYSVTIIGLVAGFITIGLAFLPAISKIESVKREGFTTIEAVPNLILVGTGWFLIGFFLLHSHPFRQLIAAVKFRPQQEN